MTITALLPLRSLRDGKRRLRATLSPRARTNLVQTLFARTLHALRESRCIDQMVVVSPDQELLAWVQHDHHVLTVLQHGQGLNEGLEYARRVVLQQTQVVALLVVLPDLPLVQPSEIAQLVALAEERSIVIASDRHQQGTNALLMRPPDALPFAFGEGSRQRHLEAALQRGLAVRHYSSPGITLDLDTPDDFELAGLSNVPLCVC